MPLYNTKNPPPALGSHYPLNQETLFKAESLVTASTSQQVSVPLIGNTKSVRIEGDFSAAPGTFTLTVVEADVDSGSLNYTAVPSGGSITTASAGPNGAGTHFTSDLTTFTGQFLALLVTAQPSNAVTATARVTRAV